MTLGKRLRHLFLRWNGVLVAGVLALPFTIAMGLGFVWLFERGFLLWFALGSVGLFATVRLIVFSARWWVRRQGDDPDHEIDGPEADPAWTAQETAAYERARRRILARLDDPIAWEDLPAEALAVVETVAADLSSGQRSVLDFTLPEALLLVDRVATRYRDFLLANLPYSDRLSVRNMLWVWRNQGTARAAWETGYMAWRGVRLFLNPAVGVVREAERAMASGLQSELTTGMLRDIQAILLEEAAQAAIDLYSGRLRFTDAELTRIAAGHDARLAPRALVPIRIAVVGQKGAGKSALIGALRGEVSDAAPTRKVVTHDWHLRGIEAVLVDLPGLDGTSAAQKKLLDQLADADLILWVHRANRPGRAPDLTLLSAFTARQSADGSGARVPIVHVATGIDALLPGWPRPEHALSRADRGTITAARDAISAVLHGAPVVPVSAISPDWNIDTLRDALDARLDEAGRAQRHRVHMLAQKDTSWRDNLARAGQGMRTAWQRFSTRTDELPKQGKDR